MSYIDLTPNDDGSYGPPPAGQTSARTWRTRARNAGATRRHFDRRWMEFLTFRVDAVILGLVGALWAINFFGGWSGQIFLCFAFILSTLWLKTVLSLPSVLAAVGGAGLLTGSVKNGYKIYGATVAPAIMFWFQLVFGLLATWPFHWGAIGAFPVLAVGSLFLITWQWKYVSKASWIKDLSLFYGACVVTIALLMPVVAGIKSAVFAPPAYDLATGAPNWMMHPVTGAPFKRLSPAYCAGQPHGVCVDEGTGVPLVIFDLAKSNRLRMISRGY